MYHSRRRRPWWRAHRARSVRPHHAAPVHIIRLTRTTTARYPMPFRFSTPATKNNYDNRAESSCDNTLPARRTKATEAPRPATASGSLRPRPAVRTLRRRRRSLHGPAAAPVPRGATATPSRVAGGGISSARAHAQYALLLHTPNSPAATSARPIHVSATAAPLRAAHLTKYYGGSQWRCCFPTRTITYSSYHVELQARNGTHEILHLHLKRTQSLTVFIV
ncbi:hypothetical protein EVAR_78463_1 [Eumeta japonica]|uniref:Uncharacterized protein n=1 Tax=Eumeta variegata TaxID=151549 RepID=A0A4C1TYU8_EUMVA|nr:hypothetical protein EVAR_78463_1 [Eumeta japonica]